MLLRVLCHRLAISSGSCCHDGHGQGPSDCTEVTWPQELRPRTRLRRPSTGSKKITYCDKIATRAWMKDICPGGAWGIGKEMYFKGSLGHRKNNVRGTRWPRQNMFKRSLGPRNKGAWGLGYIILRETWGLEGIMLKEARQSTAGTSRRGTAQQAQHGTAHKTATLAPNRGLPGKDPS